MKDDGDRRGNSSRGARGPGHRRGGRPSPTATGKPSRTTNASSMTTRAGPEGNQCRLSRPESWRLNDSGSEVLGYTETTSSVMRRHDSDCPQNHVSEMSPPSSISVKIVTGKTPVKQKKTRFSRFIGPGNGLVECALKRHVESSGGNPDRRCSSQPEALGADQEVTNGLKHSKIRLR